MFRVGAAKSCFCRVLMNNDELCNWNGCFADNL